MPRPLSALPGRSPTNATPLGLFCAPCSRVTRSVCQSCVSLSGRWCSPPPSLSFSPCLLPILLPYLLTLEVAKVDSLCFSLSSKLSTPVWSPYSYLPPLLSKKSPLPSHLCMHPATCLCSCIRSASELTCAPNLSHPWEPLAVPLTVTLYFSEPLLLLALTLRVIFTPQVPAYLLCTLSLLLTVMVG